jgi:hypothetical protein
MRKSAQQLGRLAFAGLLVAGLAFGTAHAVSGVRNAECSLCEWPDQEECDTCCREVLMMEGGVCFESDVCLCF